MVLMFQKGNIGIVCAHVRSAFFCEICGVGKGRSHCSIFHCLDVSFSSQVCHISPAVSLVKYAKESNERHLLSTDHTDCVVYPLIHAGVVSY